MALDPQHELQGALSGTQIAPISGPSEVALRLQESEVAVIQLSQYQLVWRRFRRHRLAMIGLGMLATLVLIAICAPFISPETFNHGWNLFNGQFVLADNHPPVAAWPWQENWKYILGADENGHSILMWVTYGARISLLVGLCSTILTMVIGILFGSVAGYFGHWVDAVVMRTTDVFLTLPQLPLLILLSYTGLPITGFPKHSPQLIVLLFGILSWPGPARLVRSYYLTFRSQEFTEAARAVGVSDARIIFRHILPNALSPIIVAATLAVAGFIVAEAAIDFLGIGINFPNVSWGLALSSAEDNFANNNWWATFFPGLMLLLTTLSINFMGDGLRDALDVRTKTE
jgi:peptide/nickel transport system permease protein